MILRALNNTRARETKKEDEKIFRERDEIVMGIIKGYTKPQTASALLFKKYFILLTLLTKEWERNTSQRKVCCNYC
jgi:hypothetical protein